MMRAGVALALVIAMPIAPAVLACSTSSMPAAGDAAVDGAAEACPNDLPSACPVPTPSFTSTILPLVGKRCWGCHADGGVEAQKHNLETYDTIFAERRSMLTQVYGCLMPPADAGALLPEERAALLSWLVCGAPSN